MSTTTKQPRLVLPLKAEYFNAIKAGEKLEEYRLVNPYWTNRLLAFVENTAESAEPVTIELTLGYPAADDFTRRLVLPWRGFVTKMITHPYFGTDPVDVYAIDVSGAPCGTIKINGDEYQRFIRWPAEVDDGTLRCIGCGQIDDELWHDHAICEAERSRQWAGMQAAKGGE